MSEEQGRTALQTGSIRAVFDNRNGALIELANVDTGWAIQGRSALARSFALYAPLPERLLHEIDGRDQRRPEIRADAHAVAFVWRGLDSPHAGRLDIDLTVTVTAEDGQLRWEGDIANGSPYCVESVMLPCIGDLTRPGDGPLTRATMAGCGLHYAPLWPQFHNERGYWGVEHPIQMAPAPESPFVLTLGAGEGLYLGCHDTDAEQRVEWTFHLKPGYSTPMRAPDRETIGGEPVRIECCALHHPFVAPGETRRLSPIVVEPFQGDWQDGVDRYRAWRATWMVRKPPPAWLTDVHAWQQLQMNSWGDSLRVSYDELTRYGEDCVRHGVRAMQLVGWTRSGQDGRLPDHDVEPRLGTRDQLRRAIAALRGMGVHVILYEKYTCVDKGSERYEPTLRRLASKDAFGNVHGHEGWRYDTPAHLSGINIRPYAWMCMNSEEWQDLAVEEMVRTLDLAPDGILLDESQWHGANAFYCFDPSHGHRVPAYNFAGDAAFERKAAQALADKREDLVFAGEGPYDLQNRSYNLSYLRASIGHVPVMRYIDPDLPMMNWVYGYDDRESINLCLLYRYIISYEPRHFKGRLDEFPDTLAYGKSVDALRTAHRAYLWDAEFRGERGATVLQDGVPYRPYAVYHRKDDGRRAVVIVNHDEKAAASVSVTLDPPGGVLLMATPERPDPAVSNGEAVVAARSAVALLEQ